MRLNAPFLLFTALAAALPSPDISDPPYSENTLHLEKSNRPAHTASIHRRSNSVKLIESSQGMEFATTIKVGSQNFKVIVDTGSSDTWLAGEGFQCINPQGDLVALQQCGFAQPYLNPNDNALQQTDAESNQNFQASYGDGEALLGVVANDKVTLAGISFTTEIAVALTVSYVLDAKFGIVL